VEFIDIPTEQTTAITDAILAVIAIVAAVYLKKIGDKDRSKSIIWFWFFILLASVAILGSIAHGFKMSKEFNMLLWYPLNLSLGLLVAIFVVAVLFDIRGKFLAYRLLPLMLSIAVCFFIFTLFWSGYFLVFMIYASLALFFALGGYIWLASKGRLGGAWIMVLGIFTTIIAAGVQASKAISFTLIWSFDHNGVYHLIQTVGIVLLVAGLRKALLFRV
jgi:hypothetical protein